MNKLKIQTADGQEQEISVQFLAQEGAKLGISANGRLALTKMSQNSIQAEARNDANVLLWFATFGPALFSVLAQHEAALNQALKEKENVAGATVQSEETPNVDNAGGAGSTGGLN